MFAECSRMGRIWIGGSREVILDGEARIGYF